ncbi:MAG: dTDP-4-dehydrorhamnose reductase [Afipia sp.]|nr:dTDP-4-dehydrorhamnose reductase [Afipia sp.]
MTVPRILLLGKSGQVGSALQVRLAGRGETFAPDRDACDLANVDQLRDVIRGVQPNIIINAAAYTAVDRAEDDADICFRANAIAPGVIAEEAESLGARLIHYSTDYVFDGAKEAAYLEEDMPSPLNVYGRAKLAGDRAISAATDNHTIVRVGWVYGLAGHNFAKTILRLAAERDELRIVDDQVGAPTSAEFIAEVTTRIVDCWARDAGPNAGKEARGVFNLAPSGRVSWHSYAVELIREAKRHGWSLRIEEDRIIPIASEQYRTAAARPKNSLLDTRKIRQAFDLDIPAWQVHLKQFIAELGAHAR